uniref:Reverse transcriptase zinc-binding domain-containing protein n=1 Tax=Cannabis sativa TaxID=3483 RepID=A0A803QKP5_CANSA
MFKINVDGDVFQATNGYGAGVIVWDYQGRLVEAFSVYKMGGTQSKVAKIICIKKALRWHEGKNVQEDHWYWIKDRVGVYTVKIAYHLLQQLKGNDGLDHLYDFLKSLWQLQLPPRVKDLLWRAGSNFLPTKVQLRSRHVVRGDTTCSLWNSALESALHLFVNCNFAQNCWRKALQTVLKALLQLGFNMAF